MRWFYNLKTLKKLLLGFAVVAAIMAGVGYMGMSGISRISDMQTLLYERELLGVSAIKEANTQLISIGRGVRQIMLSQTEDGMRRAQQVVERATATFNSSIDAAEKTLVRDDAKALLASIRETAPGYFELLQKVSDLKQQGQDSEALTTLNNARAQADQMDDWMTKLVSIKEQVANDLNEQGNELTAETSAMMTAIIVAGVILALAIGFFIARIIATPLTQAVHVLEKFAAGDFTVSMEADTKDEVGQMAEALNHAIDTIQTAMSGVRQVADDVASASMQLSSASEQLASGAQESASSLEETASSLEEITATVKQNADNADQANQLSNSSRETAEKGGAVVGDAVTAMGEINQASKKISDIIITIDEIAFQTNLLALNAAVEAARAGEQGRGFAVVAGEVRNLAQRSASAAKEIKTLIQDSVQKVEAGSELVNRSGQTLEEIVNSVKRVTDIVAEIAAASREQAAGIDQVNKAMAQMDQVTQANASQTEEMSGTAVALSSQGEELIRLMSRFKLAEQAARQQTKKRAPQAAPANGHKPQPKKATPATPANGQRTESRANGKKQHELDLLPVGAAAGWELDGFEEF